MTSKLDIPLHGPSLNIVKQCGLTLSKVLQSKFGCVATFEGVDVDRDKTNAQQKSPAVVPDKRCTVKLAAGVKVSVGKADLTNVQVDAVVNAANANLQHYGGLALALSHAGGPQIQAESDDYIQRHGHLSTGDAIVTDAGFLPCNKIIHAVGPCLQPYPTKSDVMYAEPLLSRAIRSILERVKENHLKTVAIPAISSGLFNYPLPLCANTIVSSVKDYYENSSSHGHLPDEILLVNNDDPTVNEMERACYQIFGHPKPATYSQAAAAAAKPSTPTVQIGNVLLTLKQGKIEEQRTDVIVNSASSNRDLNIGQISTALLQKAGQGMQWEIYNAYGNKYVIITGPYKLNCREVYHTFCADTTRKVAQGVLYESVLECLEMAVARRRKSVAFPAIGTGGLGFDKNKAAYIMSRAVADFAKKSPPMIEVHFVIYPSDNDTYKAFVEQIAILQRDLSPPPSFTQAPEHRGDFRDSKPRTPKIILCSPSDETAREADRWLSGLFQFSGSVTICNNFIQHLGEQEYQQLSQLIKKGVFIEESFEKGHAHITVDGNSLEDVGVAVLQVEAMLCNIQEEFVREEERAMLQIPTKNMTFQRIPVDCKSSLFSEKLSDLKNEGLCMLKLEKVDNPALQTLFDLKKNQLQSNTTRKMFQCVPAQFCEMVSHIGFHTEFAPPADPAYGEGIYFAATLRKAMEVWQERNDEYLYFVEAEVLTGKSTLGKPGLILPPPMDSDPQVMYDSVNGGGRNISVIFSGYQALPKYIITCKVL
ncbi:protein mono-ADP-ribosyltransferase PARP9 [Toxotes jaculatrix]|uniref:protein mono-ADP-ribosyltransferase PARP9 n=1 Tax=Toxotes jaculatrix TaxID=941984 RepID=UPI001B3AF4EE|nr:protein mono-ADP-ribosyltransferase PARP9 [Toxotes jaculatrix]XP_040913510.1 protein mono-ADP-ribosyltransferase PARP9 [Toxotes jaculatrix]